MRQGDENVQQRASSAGYPECMRGTTTKIRGRLVGAMEMRRRGLLSRRVNDRKDRALK